MAGKAVMACGVPRRFFRPSRDCGHCWGTLPTVETVGYCRVSLAGHGASSSR